MTYCYRMQCINYNLHYGSSPAWYELPARRACPKCGLMHNGLHNVRAIWYGQDKMIMQCNTAEERRNFCWFFFWADKYIKACHSAHCQCLLHRFLFHTSSFFLQSHTHTHTQNTMSDTIEWCNNSCTFCDKALGAFNVCTYFFPWSMPNRWLILYQRILCIVRKNACAMML